MVKVNYTPPEPRQIKPRVIHGDKKHGSATNYAKENDPSKVDGSVKCSCSPGGCCITCDVTFGARITVSLTQEDHHGFSQSPNRTYGHEQRHVQSMTEKVRQKVIHPLKQVQRDKEIPCDQQSANLQKTYQEKLEEVIANNTGGDGNRDHDTNPFTPAPEDATGYPPLRGTPRENLPSNQMGPHPLF